MELGRKDAEKVIKKNVYMKEELMALNFKSIKRRRINNIEVISN